MNIREKIMMWHGKVVGLLVSQRIMFITQEIMDHSDNIMPMRENYAHNAQVISIITLICNIIALNALTLKW